MSNLYNKYKVTKSDGSPVDLNAQYFVLRVDTDPAARFALVAYANFIKRSDPQFSRELLVLVKQYEGAVEQSVQPTGGRRCENGHLNPPIADLPFCLTCKAPIG
jgi:hypothetical protein